MLPNVTFRTGAGLMSIAMVLMPLWATFSTAVWSQTDKTNAELREDGKKLLSKYCARCHTIGISGISPHPQAPAFRDLSLQYPVEHLAEALAEGILTGHPDMPVFEFQAEEIDQIIAYLESIQAK